MDKVNPLRNCSAVTAESSLIIVIGPSAFRRSLYPVMRSSLAMRDKLKFLVHGGRAKPKKKNRQAVDGEIDDIDDDDIDDEEDEEAGGAGPGGLFRDFFDAQLSQLAYVMTPETFRRRDVIAAQGTPMLRVHLIKSGSVKVIMQLKTKSRRGGTKKGGAGTANSRMSSARAASGKIPATGTFNELSFGSVTKACSIANVGR